MGSEVVGEWIFYSNAMDDCGNCVTRVIVYKAARTLIKGVTELHLRNWLCMD